MAAAEKMNDDEFAAYVATLIDQSENYRDEEQQPKRLKAIEFYKGEIADLQAQEGRSSATSRDVRDVMKKLLPSVMRAIFGSGKPVEYAPVGVGDEEFVEQASDYVNYVVVPKSDIKKQIKSAIHDAMLLRNGILKVWVEEEETTTVERYSGLDQEGFESLVSESGSEILDMASDESGISIEIRRTEKTRSIKVCALPPEEYLIHPKAKTTDDSPLCGHYCLKTRSDLISMGYDKSRLDDLSAADGDLFSDEDDARRENAYQDDLEGALEELDYYEVFVRADYDGDGIAELRRVVMIGGFAEENVFENDPWDIPPFFDVRIEDEPHKWEGRSIFDDVEELQRIKTVLFRETLDNIYWQNSQQPTVRPDAIVDMEAVYNPEFGRPIELKPGFTRDEAIGFNTVPFVADSAFQMISYVDETIVDRTGISDASGGLDPNAIQNVTAKASAMFESAGIAQVEMIVETIADHLTPFFKHILKLTVENQDKPTMARLRGKVVEVDPRFWNTSMDAVVNTGLGIGSPERQIAKMQMVIGYQEKLLANFGADNPYVKPENLYASLEAMVEAGGVKSPDRYFTRPDPNEVAQKLQEQAQAPSPEEMKAKTQMEIESAKLQNSMQMKQLEIQANRDKENAQMQADLRVKEVEMGKEQVARSEELQSKAILEQQKLDFERTKLAQERELKILELEAKERETNRRRDDEIQRHQAKLFDISKENAA